MSVLQRTSIAVLLAGLVIVNLVLFSRGKSFWSTTPVNIESEIEKLDDKDYASSLLNELVEAKQGKILEDLKKNLTEENSEKFLSEIREEIKTQNEEQFKNDLRKSIDSEFTQEYFDVRKKNYEVLEQLQGKYFNENREKIKDLLLLEALDLLLNSETPESALEIKKKVSKILEKTMSKKEYYRYLLKDVLAKHKPKMDPLTDEEKGPDLKSCAFEINPVIYSKEKLSRVKFSKDRFNDFQQLHDLLVEVLRKMPTPPAHMFQGDGIVISGGGPYFAGAMVAIAQIRETGSKLPIELMVNTEDEYDEELCSEMKDKFEAKCVVIEREIGKDLLEELALSKFQLKILGLLVTSFDNVIALDADNMALKNPDTLLDSDEYLKTRFLLWPDLWQRTISTTYYDIARIRPGQPIKRHGIKNKDSVEDYYHKSPNDVHFHDLEGVPSAVSTETGQMVFSKREHFRSMYLSVYYNMYGESHYWRMFYQGSPGEGDRDTFVPALHVFNEPYHIVGRATWLAGFKEKDGSFQETTIVQYDPSTTLVFAEEWKAWLGEKGMDTRMKFDQNNDYTRDLVKKFHEEKGEAAPKLPEVFFLHIHRPKLNPIFQSDPEGYFNCFQQRNLGLPGTYDEHFGSKDWELLFNTISRWVACKGLTSKKWWESVDREQDKVCEEISQYLDFLKKDSVDSEAQKFQNIALD